MLVVFFKYTLDSKCDKIVNVCIQVLLKIISHTNSSMPDTLWGAPTQKPVVSHQTHD